MTAEPAPPDVLAAVQARYRQGARERVNGLCRSVASKRGVERADVAPGTNGCASESGCC